MSLWMKVLSIKLLLTTVLLSGFLLPSRLFESRLTQEMSTVARIEARYVDIVPGQKKAQSHQALGSGVVISPRGHILTCEHVIHGSPVSIDVVLYGSSIHYQATVLRRSFRSDLAVLCLVNAPKRLRWAHIAPDSPVVGDNVTVIGHPYGMEWSVTRGIISGLHREGLVPDMTQTDAAVNPGNSGGPVFDRHGDVVAIVESYLKGSMDMGFAVSRNAISSFLSVFQGLEAAL